jgi:hypothetical protein
MHKLSNAAVAQHVSLLQGLQQAAGTAAQHLMRHAAVGLEQMHSMHASGKYTERGIDTPLLLFPFSFPFHFTDNFDLAMLGGASAAPAGSLLLQTWPAMCPPVTA